MALDKSFPRFSWWQINLELRVIKTEHLVSPIILPFSVTVVTIVLRVGNDTRQPYFSAFFYGVDIWKKTIDYHINWYSLASKIMFL